MHCTVTLSDTSLRRELQVLLQDALHSLSRKQFEAWSYRHVSQLSDVEMARAMGVNKRTARTHLVRAEAHIQRGDYFATVQQLAEESEDKTLFLDLVSMFLNPEAYAAHKSSSSDNTQEAKSADLATIQRGQGGVKND
jgi:lipopolysaccharide biosynthesis regulator YciM